MWLECGDDDNSRPSRGDVLLFTGKLAIKATESNAKGLQSTQWIAEVHGEDVLRYSAKLHHDILHYTQTHQTAVLEIYIDKPCMCWKTDAICHGWLHKQTRHWTHAVALLANKTKGWTLGCRRSSLRPRSDAEGRSEHDGWDGRTLRDNVATLTVYF